MAFSSIAGKTVAYVAGGKDEITTVTLGSSESNTITYKDLNVPRGIAVSPDGQTLYVAS